MRSLWLLALLCVPFSSPSIRQQASPKTIRIDGSEWPDLIPDHCVWRNNFLRLSEIKKQGGEADVAYDLPLSKADADALYKEAALQPQRDAECDKRMIGRREELRQQNATPETTARALDAITIDCRTKDLDAADRVMDALTDEGRTTLAAWIEKRRRAIVAFVAEGEMETFKLPR
jgi:hypothetical protein